VTDDIANDPYHQQQLTQYFPSELRRNYLESMPNHPLRAEIISTMLANQMVNEMGCNFVTRLQEETGATVVDIANAYAASREIYGFAYTFEQIRKLDNVASSEAQYELLFIVRRTLRRLARWILRNRPGKQSVEELVARYREDVIKVEQTLEKCLVAEEVEEHHELAQVWVEQGVGSELANYVSRLSSLLSAVDIAEIAAEASFDVERASKLYFHLGDRLSLHWFLNQINGQAVDNNWQALARAAFREDLDWQQRLLTAQVLRCGCGGDSDDVILSLDNWMETNTHSLQRWENILNEFKVGNVHEFAKFSVALRELSLLNLNCANNL
jgi:glutamate dehydrogenase